MRSKAWTIFNGNSWASLSSLDAWLAWCLANETNAKVHSDGSAEPSLATIQRNDAMNTAGTVGPQFALIRAATNATKTSACN
eukprot:2035622-Amphidinium_carterae.1